MGLTGTPVPLPLGEVAAKQTERARMLPEKHWHSDSIALTKSLLIAAQRLCLRRLALSVIAARCQLSQRESLKAVPQNAA